MSTLTANGVYVAYLSFYGILCLTSLVLVIEWGYLAFKRAEFLAFHFKTLYHDRYMVIATALSLNSIGMAIIAGTRVSAIIVNDDYAMPSTYLLTMLAVGSMLMLSISKFGLVWATHLSKWHLAWIVTIVATILWIGFSFWWVTAEGTHYVLG